MNLKTLLYWFPMIAIAFANATLRQLIFIKYFNELRAHQLSTVTLIILCAIYVRIVIPALHLQNATQAWLTGFTWMILTILFEFSLGRLTNKSWTYLLENYNIATGHIWPLFLLALLVMPYLFYSLKLK
jgi:hypothetical protein